MIAAIHLDDELDAGGTEVRDEAPANGHLPTKADAELACLERGPQASLRLREARAVLPSEELEPSGGSRSRSRWAKIDIACHNFLRTVVLEGSLGSLRLCQDTRPALSP